MMLPQASACRLQANPSVAAGGPDGGEGGAVHSEEGVLLRLVCPVNHGYALVHRTFQDDLRCRTYIWIGARKLYPQGC
jgi:hypothetical protein